MYHNGFYRLRLQNDKLQHYGRGDNHAGETCHPGGNAMTDRVQRNSLMDSIGPRGLQNDNVENCYWILRDAQDDAFYRLSSIVYRL